MSEAHGFDMKEIFHQLDNPLQFRLSRIKETKKCFIPETSDREEMRKTLNKYITALDSAHRHCLFCKMQAVAFRFAHLLLS